MPMLIPWCPWYEKDDDSTHFELQDTANLRKVYMARNVLKVAHLLGLAIAMVMCFFPHLLLTVLHADEFTGNATTAMYVVMGLLGNQIFAISSIRGDIARDAVSTRVQSVGALCASINFSTIALTNIYRLLVGTIPSAMPQQTVVAVTGIALVVSGLCLAGWVIGGSVLPDRRALVPKGKAKWPLLIGMVGLSVWAIACSFYARELAEFLTPGVLDSLPSASAMSNSAKKTVKDAADSFPSASSTLLNAKKNVKEAVDSIPGAANTLLGAKKSVKDSLPDIGSLYGPVPMIMMMIQNAGRAMGLLILETLAICSVGNEEVSYRLLRCWCLSQVFSFGMLAKDSALMTATGWPAPWYNLLFAQNFFTIFCMVDAMGAIPFKLLTKEEGTAGEKDSDVHELGTPEKQGAGASKFAKKVK